MPRGRFARSVVAEPGVCSSDEVALSFDKTVPKYE